MELKKEVYGYPEKKDALNDLYNKAKVVSYPNVLVSVSLKPFNGMFFITIKYVKP
jgi:hypothetical protein